MLRAWERLIFRSGWVGRSCQPCLRAAPTELSRRLIESSWHTTRVLLVLDFFSAEDSERGFGTSPPAHGFTEQSGAGSGREAGGSRGANAPAGTANAPAIAHSPTAMRPPSLLIAGGRLAERDRS